jgi:hypothetical protein
MLVEVVALAQFAVFQFAGEGAAVDTGDFESWHDHHSIPHYHQSSLLLPIR